MRNATLTLLLFCLLAGAIATSAGVKRATLVGKLVDGNSEPVQGVDVTVRGADFEQTVTTDKKGRFKVAVPDAGLEYEIRFEREGAAAYSEALVFDPRGGSHSREWSMNLTPPDATTRSMTALEAYNAAVKAFNGDNPDLAIQKFNEALAEDPEFVDAHLKIAWIHASRAEHEQAAAAASRALELDPNQVDALRILYGAESTLGRDGASATLDRLAEAAPGPDLAAFAFNEGVAAHRSGDLERARARYALATRLDPALGRAHTALAGVLLESQEYDAALASSERALELDPQDVRGVAIRYNTLIGLGRRDDAQAMLDELQRLAPDAVAQAYLERGALLFDRGQIEDARTVLERAIAADPKSAQAHYRLGLCHMSQAHTADATEHLEMFLELAPGDPNADAARRLLETLRPPE